MYTFSGRLAKIDCERLIKESAEQPGQISWFSLDCRSTIVLGKRGLVKRASSVGLDLGQYAEYNSVSGYSLVLSAGQLAVLRVNDLGDCAYTVRFRSMDLASRFASDLKQAEQEVHTVTVGSLL